MAIVTDNNLKCIICQFVASFDSLLPNDAMETEIMAHSGSGNGSVPSGTKPLPEPMLTRHYWHLSNRKCIRCAVQNLSFESKRLKMIMHLLGHNELMTCDVVLWPGLLINYSRFHSFLYTLQVSLSVICECRPTTVIAVMFVIAK